MARPQSYIRRKSVSSFYYPACGEDPSHDDPQPVAPTLPPSIWVGLLRTIVSKVPLAVHVAEPKVCTPILVFTATRGQHETHIARSGTYFMTVMTATSSSAFSSYPHDTAQLVSAHLVP